jgi:hypothetical protein
VAAGPRVGLSQARIVGGIEGVEEAIVFSGFNEDCR